MQITDAKKKLNYHDPAPQNLITKKKRQRSILWFITPYNKSVKIKIGKFFLQIKTIFNIFKKSINYSKSLTEII